ncbi:MAG: 30S ribosomal protein S8 [Patescibacteria group bacterium]
MMDPIADMLTRIRNASLTRKQDVLIPFSKVKLAVAKILEKEKYITAVEIVDEPIKAIKIQLKYQNKKPVINSLRRVSKTSNRVYVKKEDLPRVLNGFGVAIISTSKGMMTNKEAKKVGLGGELVCEIY